MYSEISSGTWPRMEAYLNNLGIPVRVLNASKIGFTPPDSWRGMARANNASISTCENTGLTIVLGSAPGSAEYWYGRYLPSNLILNKENFYYSADWIVPTGWRTIEGDDDYFRQHGIIDTAQENPEYPPYVVTTDRTVWITPLINIYKIHFPDEHIDYEVFLGEPIARAMDTEAHIRRKVSAVERARDQFITNMSAKSTKRIKAIKKEIDYHRSDQLDYEKRLREIILNIEECSRNLRSLEAEYNEDANKENALAAWNSLVDHPKLDHIEFSNNGIITILTTVLTLNEPGSNRTAELGAIELIIDTSNNSIKLINRTHNRDDMAHPHCSQGYEPCFGNISSLIYDLLAKDNLSAFFEVILQYLESYNPDDSYGYENSHLFFGTSLDEYMEKVEQQRREAVETTTVNNPPIIGIASNTTIQPFSVVFD